MAYNTGLNYLPEWRNGRRVGLKIPCPNGRVSSNLTSGISQIVLSKVYLALKHISQVAFAQLEQVRG